jgi:isopentenyl phosphate kinase
MDRGMNRIGGRRRDQERSSPNAPPILVVKLGGSVITNKEGAPFSYRDAIVQELGREMCASGLPVVVVHGGGSFGHTVARQYGLTSRSASASSDGVTETRRSMLDLDQMVCSSLSSAGMRPYPFAPASLLVGDGRLRMPHSPAFIEDLVRGGMTPVTFGDVIHDGTGFRILSGDTICVELANMLRAPACVMAMDVDGLLGEDGQVVKILEAEVDDGNYHGEEEEEGAKDNNCNHDGSGETKKGQKQTGEGGGAAGGGGEQGTVIGAPTIPNSTRSSLGDGGALWSTGRRRTDATGGISFKVKEALRMASSGTEVRLVSGLNPAEFSKALKGVEFHGTTVRVSPGVQSGE